ncbi:MAG: class I SAM-dependent methyltransferase [Anaerolineales bacterium]|nr:MAG: class I SAM-dependent methyltransferase [Anaerolineales bacterium]
MRNEAMEWILWGIAFVILILIGYWQLVIAEGAHLGPRVVTLLYDWTAHRYDRVKSFDEAEEARFLGHPLAAALSDWDEPWVLDVATGTGRLPQALLHQPEFAGQVFGLDLSAKMLRVADQHLKSHQSQASLLLASATQLPFANQQFEAVTCLEALEFFADARQTLQEMVRVLQPGGWLLITNRVGWEARLMPGHTWTRAQLVSILRGLPLTDISVRPWQSYYDLAWARKRDLEMGNKKMWGAIL